MKPPIKPPATPSLKAVDIATSALETAVVALRAYADTINALEARIARLEAAIAVKQEKLAEPMRAAIDLETRSHVDTATAARWLNRNPQTLRNWACFENGPLRPRRVGWRLAWTVADIRAILTAGPARRR